MRGQIALEFFFAMALVYLSVSWLVNYLNAGYDSGRFLALREEKLVAAEIAGVVNSACMTNMSATINAPCIINSGRPASYWLQSDGNILTVNYTYAADVARAKALCQINNNLTAYNPSTGMFEDKLMTCEGYIDEGTQICVHADGAGKVNLSMGRCNS